MEFTGIFIILMIVFWLSDRLSRTKPGPHVEPWHRGISTEELIRLYDSCDLLVFGRIENLENYDVERNVMGEKYDLVEVHLGVKVSLPKDLRDMQMVISSCYYTRKEKEGAGGSSAVMPELDDKVCLGLFMGSVRKNVFILGSNNPFYRINDSQWMPYTRRAWIDLIPPDKPLVCDHTAPGDIVH
jgi:hypothetical protein